MRCGESGPGGYRLYAIPLRAVVLRRNADMITTMQEFEIISFEGALPLKFGMLPDEVAGILGPPRVAAPNWQGILCYGYDAPDVNVGFGGEGQSANHFGFTRGSKVLFQGLDLFGDPMAWRAVVARSHDCHEYLGTVTCCDLGLEMSGFHEDDPSQLSVVVFPQGAREKYRSRFKPFEPGSHA